jgi:hypothetical protein
LQPEIRTIMNIRTLLLSLFTASMVPASAIDRVVDITGTGGTFTTINAALAAAADGDRILVIPHAGFFVENLVLDKSLQLMSAVEGQRFNLQGNITLAPAAAGREITIQNVLFPSGFGITANASPAGTRTAARVLDCKLLGGNVILANNNYNVVIARDSVMNGGVTFRVGKVLGNFINGFITCSSDVVSEDVNMVVGNRIELSQGNYTGLIPIFLGNSTQYIRFENNYILGTNGLSFSNGTSVIGANQAKAGTGMNTIVNNTIHSNGNLFVSAVALINANVGSSPNLRIWNNLITASGTVSGIAIANGSSVPVHYNAVKSPLSIAGTPTGTNLLNSNSHSFINSTTGTLSAGADAIDAGDPSPEFTDLDLTRNDIGCYGGSFSLENFLAPGSASAVVTFVDAPRRVLQGAPIDIKAEGFDR